jgi:nucleoside-diphosphate-sugar epimerase
MKILVVGGAGFIGHNVVSMLEDEGHSCAILDNCTDYGILDRKQHDLLIAERMERVNAELHRGSIEDKGDVLRVFAKFQPDVVMHLASFPRAKIVNTNPLWGREVMIDGTENLLEAAALYDVKRFMYVSSSMVYGDFDGGIKETGDKKPGSLYATYKLAGEQLTQWFAEKAGFEWSVVRPSAVYGPRDVEDRVVSKFFANAMNNGTLNVNGIDERLDFSHVSDVARGMCLAATHPAAANEAFNITRGEDETILTAATIIQGMVGKGEVLIRERDMSMPSRGFLSVNKASRLLGYKPMVNIQEGFQDYYDWIKSHTV